MKPLLTVLSFITIINLAYSQHGKKAMDKQSIKNMCGCYQVGFEYAETFRSDTSYSFHEPYTSRAPAEWIFVDEETDDKIVIQHILVVQDTVVIKHWRQDWLYEHTQSFEYVNKNTWQKKVLPDSQIAGQWTQKVYHVDDGPRYEGSATWIHEDGTHYWEGSGYSPLPRRERTKRDDYNMLQRRNRHQLTDYGWIHEQDNKKVLRQHGTDSVLVEEKGRNTYRKIDESECLAAKKWWREHQDYWRLVRSVWADIFSQYDRLQFAGVIDEKRRWQHLFELQNSFDPDNRDEMHEEIHANILNYLQ